MPLSVLVVVTLLVPAVLLPVMLFIPWRYDRGLLYEPVTVLTIVMLIVIGLALAVPH